MELVITTGLMMGLLGSFHCAGMCGPIAVAIPLNNRTIFSRITGSLLYNLGRTLTYVVMGLIFGLLGQGLKLGGFQQWVSVIMGVIMVTSVIFPSLYKNRFDFEKTAFSFVGKIKIGLGLLFRKKTYGSLFAIGLLNGLLPCGLVYMAIAGAIATTNAYSGALFMMLFGLGTIPMLFAFNMLGNALSGALKQRMNKVIPYMIVVVGLLFILRGLNLGIPYLSPPSSKLDVHQKTEMMH